MDSLDPVSAARTTWSVIASASSAPSSGRLGNLAEAKRLTKPQVQAEVTGTHEIVHRNDRSRRAQDL